MANYYLKGVDDEQWRHFKAACDLQGITIKQAFLEHIDITVRTVKKYPGPYKPRPAKQKEGGKHSWKINQKPLLTGH